MLRSGGGTPNTPPFFERETAFNIKFLILYLLFKKMTVQIIPQAELEQAIAALRNTAVATSFTNVQAYVAEAGEGLAKMTNMPVVEAIVTADLGSPNKYGTETPDHSKSEYTVALPKLTAGSDTLSPRETVKTRRGLLAVGQKIKLQAFKAVLTDKEGKKTPLLVWQVVK